MLSSVIVTDLIELTGLKLTPRQLLKYFHTFLELNPKPSKKQPYTRYINLKVDGSYFGRTGCTLVFKEGQRIIYWDYVERENFRNYIKCFQELSALGFIPLSVTSDKHGSIVGVVKYLFPSILHQYCLVHIQKRCESLLTKNPETQAGSDLLEISKYLNQITNTKEKGVFIKWLELYENRYKDFLNQRTYSNDKLSKKKWWYTHKNVRAAFRHVKTSLPNMFFYLDNPNIPKDTNGLEGGFTHLKSKVGSHRGLSNYRREYFVNWYWYLKSIYYKKQF